MVTLAVIYAFVKRYWKLLLIGLLILVIGSVLLTRCGDAPETVDFDKVQDRKQQVTQQEQQAMKEFLVEQDKLVREAKQLVNQPTPTPVNYDNYTTEQLREEFIRAMSKIQ